MRGLVTNLAVAACLLVLAPAAGAKIVVGKSIAGVALGDSAKTVKRKLGSPQAAKSQVFYYTRKKLQVRFNKGVVTELNTFNTRERTAEGVGPGSTIAAVGKAYPGSCVNKYHCAIAIGRTSTQFDQGTGRGGRVQAVKVQKLLTYDEI